MGTLKLSDLTKGMIIRMRPDAHTRAAFAVLEAMKEQNKAGKALKDLFALGGHGVTAKQFARATKRMARAMQNLRAAAYKLAEERARMYAEKEDEWLQQNWELLPPDVQAAILSGMDYYNRITRRNGWE